MSEINEAELKGFILEASRATYASGDESMKQKQPDGSTTIRYESRLYKYHDNYFGGEPYGGREVIFLNDKPLWMMVYYGFVNEGVSRKDVYGFLMESLSNATIEMPYRGPAHFENDDWKYKNSLVGEIAKFSGTEKILKGGVCVYEAHYIGGFVDR
jgi:hypothetical protein